MVRDRKRALKSQWEECPSQSLVFLFLHVFALLELFPKPAAVLDCGLFVRFEKLAGFIPLFLLFKTQPPNWGPISIVRHQLGSDINPTEDLFGKSLIHFKTTKIYIVLAPTSGDQKAVPLGPPRQLALTAAAAPGEGLRGRNGASKLLEGAQDLLGPRGARLRAKSEKRARKAKVEGSRSVVFLLRFFRGNPKVFVFFSDAFQGEPQISSWFSCFCGTGCFEGSTQSAAVFHLVRVLFFGGRAHENYIIYMGHHIITNNIRLKCLLVGFM